MNNIAVAEIMWSFCRILALQQRANLGVWNHGLLLCIMYDSMDIFVCVMTMMMIMLMASSKFCRKITPTCPLNFINCISKLFFS